MIALVFVDTNILIYCWDTVEPHKQKKAMAWMTHLWETRSGRLSYQVLQEFYVTVTSKLDPGLDSDSARAQVRSLLSWRPLHTNDRVMEGAWQLQDRYGLSWWDSLIVSTAQIADCRFLLTEDLQPDQELDGIHVLNPFLRSPDFLVGK